MKITLEIQRSNPETKTEAFFQKYDVEVKPTDRVLDAIIDVKRNQDGSLAFRRSCAHGVCGSDAMLINGVETLACKTLVQDVATSDGDVVRLEPLKHQPVQRDLMVDQTRFFSELPGGETLFHRRG
jgi:succinate dehydrogenase / fumarate reductase iron-sulfur subunit